MIRMKIPNPDEEYMQDYKCAFWEQTMDQLDGDDDPDIVYNAYFASSWKKYYLQEGTCFTEVKPGEKSSGMTSYKLHVQYVVHKKQLSDLDVDKVDLHLVSKVLGQSIRN